MSWRVLLEHRTDNKPRLRSDKLGYARAINGRGLLSYFARAILWHYLCDVGDLRRVFDQPESLPLSRKYLRPILRSLPGSLCDHRLYTADYHGRDRSLRRIRLRVIGYNCRLLSDSRVPDGIWYPNRYSHRLRGRGRERPISRQAQDQLNHPHHRHPTHSARPIGRCGYNYGWKSIRGRVPRNRARPIPFAQLDSACDVPGGPCPGVRIVAFNQRPRPLLHRE